MPSTTDHLNIANNWTSGKVVVELLGGTANAFGDKTIELDPKRARKYAISLLTAADAAEEAKPQPREGDSTWPAR